MIAGMHNIKEARIGDTIYHQNKAVEPLPGFKAARPMVFYTSSIFKEKHTIFPNIAKCFKMYQTVCLKGLGTIYTTQNKKSQQIDIKPTQFKDNNRRKLPLKYYL